MKLKNKNLAEKIVNHLLNVLIFIFAIILLISIYTGVQTRILGNDYTDFFGYSIFEVQTGSMTGTINVGDWVVVKLTQNVKIKDIVTYKLDKEYVTHRIIEAYKGTYITKGDANNAKDDPIDQKQIVGKVVGIWANFGIIRKTLFNPSVLITLIVTLFLFDYVIKKDKSEKVKIHKLGRENNVDLFINTIIKKVDLFIKLISEKAALIFDKIKNYKGNKKALKNYSIDKSESKASAGNEKESDFVKQEESTSKTVMEECFKDEDELDKTSFYRVIPVDSNEVDDKFKNVPTRAAMEEYYKDEDELDKTSFYRIIPVDATEVDDTLLEIAKNEIRESDQNEKSKNDTVNKELVQEEKSEVTLEESDTLTQINLDLLKKAKSGRKSKNTIDTAMLIKRNELNELISVLVKEDKSYVNRATIKEKFMDTYIDARYYNCYGDNDSESSGKGSISKIEKMIKEVGSELINDYHSYDAKYNDMVDTYSKYASIFILIANLETARDSITDSKVKNEFYRKEIKKYSKEWDTNKIENMISEIMKIQRNYSDAFEYFLKKLETNMFNLNFNRFSTKRDMYGLQLEHNIAFSKVYSDYIIDKTYTEGIIAEDKMVILLTLLSIQLVKDMIASDFNKKYVLYIPDSLYTKEKKLEKLLRMIDDKYAKDNVYILVTFECLLSNKQIIREVRKMGYKFVLAFKNKITIEKENSSDMYIADYIFIDKEDVDSSKLLPFIPEELKNKIVYENIVEKIGDFGGEQE